MIKKLYYLLNIKMQTQCVHNHIPFHFITADNTSSICYDCFAEVIAWQGHYTTEKIQMAILASLEFSPFLKNKNKYR